MEDEQIPQGTEVPLPQPIPTTYPSAHNGGSPTGNPLPVGLDPIALPVWPLSCVDLNDNGSSSSAEPFSLSLKLQSLPPSDDHSLKTSCHSSPLALSSAFNSSSGSGDNII
ncbi:hypothetical protein TSUD_138890 [Trifolium subterraneum]|uniref:Uncharacterized protein n=1 Tax=Trifolium subterraneum TaxID=3900 RepID=A0A2Z6PNV8_TRISU|nr:hypothetical protein TSUD_138890 [Trifolium subterraneum]